VLLVLILVVSVSCLGLLSAVAGDEGEKRRTTSGCRGMRLGHLRRRLGRRWWGFM
jgi:hypothetical protein